MQAVASLHDLVRARQELLDELHKRSTRHYILTQKLFYEYGNKAGKLLANALRIKKTRSTVHSLNDSTGRKLVTNNGYR